MIAPRQPFAQRMQSIQQSPMQGEQNSGESSNAPTQLPNQIQQSANQQQVNQDAPMGDPVDTIAQMLGLDLSAAASPDQQGQMVVSAVEALVLQLHQYVDQYGLLNGQQPEDDQNDDQLQNYEDDGSEGAEDGEGQEGSDTTQTDGDGTDQSRDTGADGQQFPLKKKKQAIAASFFDNGFETPSINSRALNGLKKGREMELLQLARDGYITPVTYKELKQEFCSTNALSLSLSQDDDSPDEFDSVCNRFRKNGKLLALGQELSEAQDQYRTLSQAKGESEEQSALVKAAEERAAQVEKKRERAGMR